MNQGVIIVVILLCSILESGYVLADRESSVLSTNPGDIEIDIAEGEISAQALTVEPESYFDVRFVSREILDHLRSYSGSDAIILKTDPGLQIGMITPEALYLRADFTENDFPITNDTGITMDDISRHLIDIAFGRDNLKLSRFNSDKDYKIFFTDEYSDSDIKTVLDFARFFNAISNVASIEDEECELSFLPGKYSIVPYYYYNITIVSPSVFKEYQDDKNTSDLLLRSISGKPSGIVSINRLVLSDDLMPKERQFYLIRGLLWSMGFHGETTRYPDSFFAKGNTNLNFSQIDIEAISLLYGGRLQKGMDMESIEKAMNLEKKKNYNVG